MKIHNLHINRFGHFRDCDLELGDGLQVIYGPNEAGKTTLLEFVRGLLFDFPGRTPYDFGGDGEVAGSATLELRDGRRIDLRRRKGNKHKVVIKIDGAPTDLDDTGLNRLLDHADRGLFESVFTFGVEQLSRGETALKHESLQSALFGGGLGGSLSPDKILGELTRQAEELFKKGGSKSTISRLVAELKTHAKEVRGALLRPEAFHDAETAVAKAATDAQELQRRVDDLRQKHAQFEKQVRAWPKWWELQRHRTERAGLQAAPRLPANARESYASITKDLKTVAAQRKQRDQAIRKLEERLADVTLDPAAVAQRAEIKSCLTLRQSFVEARDQLPERRRKRNETLRLIDHDLADLRPGWSQEDLRTLTIDVATRATLDRLSKECRQVAGLQTALAAKRDTNQTELERSRDELVQLGDPCDVSAIVAVLANETDYAADRKQRDKAQVELTKVERQLAAQIRKLTPPLPVTATAPHELPVPREETIAEFEVRFTHSREQLRSLTTSIEQDESELAGFETQLTSAATRHVIPDLNDRESARRRRDSGWNLVRRKYIAAERVDSSIAEWLAAESASSLPDAYEQAVRKADGIADEIFEHADEVATQEEKRRQRDAIQRRLDGKRARLITLQQADHTLKAEWVALWTPCDLHPLEPDAMQSWLRDHAVASTTRTNRDELAAALAQCTDRISAFEQRLRDALAQADLDIAQLLVIARQRVADAADQQRTRTDLQATIRDLEGALTTHDAESVKLAEREQMASAETKLALGRLNFPAEWDLDLAREVIEKLRATQILLASLPGEAERISAMETRVSEFNARVRALCELLDAKLLESPAELAINRLDEQVARAVDAQRVHAELSHSLEDERTELGTQEAARQHLEDERLTLLSTAKASSEDEFLEVVGRAERIAALDSAISQLDGEINLIRAGSPREEFEQALANGELTVLQAQEQECHERLQAAERERREADGREALARQALQQLDGSSAAALLTETVCRKRAALESEIDRYLPIVYARHLLQTAVRRFEKENQPEMIATVSGLLSQLTACSLVEFDRDGGGKQNMLVRRANGAERTPDQLSTGTREQLYLAIRLAYVVHYCRRSEPLPIVIDDALVNFDDRRVKHTLTALSALPDVPQVLFFTCHDHMVEIARKVVPDIDVLECPRAPS